ncbi:flavodoxin [Leuconostocaceae bacterium ESL0723]|nr:flavodoxin [Leuconostocaceae bacterium ESL0723]
MPENSPLTAQVVFATITGNNEAVADVIIADLEAAGVQVKKTEISQTEVDELAQVDIAIIVPYTYDGGSLPDEGLDFYDDLADIDLSQVIYGVAGSGDLYYEDTYCLALDSFDTQIQKSGAKKGADIVRVDLRPEEEDKKHLQVFVDDLIAAAQATKQ